MGAPARRNPAGFWMLVATVAMPLSLATGCSVPRVKPAASSMIAVRYDVEPVLASAPRDSALSTIRSDFARARRLGFTTISLEHVDRTDQSTVLAITKDEDLAATVALGELERFVTTGRLPANRTSVGNLVGAATARAKLPSHVTAVVVKAGRTAAARKRAEAVCDALVKAGVGCEHRGGTSAGASRRPAIIDVCVSEAVPAADMLENWLLQYHAALTAGRTDGIVFDRYRRIPGDPGGIDAPSHRSSAAYLSALKELLDRARVWGIPLAHAAPVDLTGLTSDVDGATVTGFSRMKRRFVLIANGSLERHARGRVELPEIIAGMPAGRAVEVPATSTKPAGRVVEAVRGRVTLPVALRPGDAALFEIF